MNEFFLKILKVNQLKFKEFILFLHNPYVILNLIIYYPIFLYFHMIMYIFYVLSIINEYLIYISLKITYIKYPI